MWKTFVFYNICILWCSRNLGISCCFSKILDFRHKNKPKQKFTQKSGVTEISCQISQENRGNKNFYLFPGGRIPKSRWRVIRWFQMPTSTSGGNVTSGPGSISQLVNIVGDKIASRKLRLCSQDQQLAHWDQLWDVHQSVITQNCVLDVDSLNRNWRWVFYFFKEISIVIY